MSSAGFLARLCHPSTLRIVIWAEASSAHNSIAAVSAQGNTVWVLILRLNSSCRRSIALVTGMRVPAPMSGRGFRDRGIWCDHPGQRRREHEGAGRPISYVELRARVSSWPPLRLARLRRERESVVVV
jgi:hypothetical protein